MQEIVTSFKKYQLTKDIKNMIKSINSSTNPQDLSVVLHKFYQEDLIGESEYITIEMKILLNRYCTIMEQKFPDLITGVYLFDEEKQEMWNAAVPNIPGAYKEYSNGLTTKYDITDGEEIPVYIKDILVVRDVERGEDITSLNHKKDLLNSGLNAFCAIPLMYNGSRLGHTAMFSHQKREFSILELKQIAVYNQFIEKRLFEKKEQLLKTIIKSKMG